ncbi:pyridoxamine 5'-phosphate oxidase family protein [Frankia sp. Cas4]|uniref:pyridoxamine 5'-phosphate oxidase family protein n=1 Tax=Frankia sp. Cas4 TaxID=3073927 RepID=UPI002AD46552|nr:pyridoxamine 5'-phosphate oxidase family protein [Frankia sp. Cas4]
MVTPPVRGWEDLSAFTLDDDGEAELLAQQTECTVVWVNATGHPLGAVVNYMFRRGRFWVTATDWRPRVAAMRRDNRVSVVVSSKGSGIPARRSLTYRGLAVVHDDRATKDWFLPEFAAAMRPGDPAKQAEFARLLDSTARVIIEVVPQRRTGFDGAKMWATAPQVAPEDLGAQ